MNVLVSSAALAASSVVPSVAHGLEEAHDRRALEAYAAWLHMERRILCMELWPHMGTAAEDVVFADNAGYDWHFRNVDWVKDPQPSSRAIPVLDLVGVQWRQKKEKLGISHEDNGRRPALPAHWPRLIEPERAADDPVFAAIETHRRAYDAYDRAITIWNEASEDKQKAAEEEKDRAGDAETHSLVALLHTLPTTAAGIAALAEYVVLAEEEHYGVIGEVIAGEFDSTGEGEPINIAATLLETIAKAARGLQERLGA